MDRHVAPLLLAAVVGLAVPVPAPAAAAGLGASPSLQGFTGLLNTPNAQVTREGTADLGYSNQPEPRARRPPPRWNARRCNSRTLA
jgi:hypothetical protein